MNLAEGCGVGRDVVQRVHAEHSIEGLVREGKRLPSRCDECRVVSKDQAVVGGQSLSAAPHHLDGQVHGDGANSDAVQKLRGPAGARGEVQNEIVRSWCKKLTGDGKVEKIVPTLYR